MARIKAVVLFLLAVLFANIFWNFLLRGSLVHQADNPAVKGLANVTS